MPKLNTSGSTQPNKNHQPVAGGQDNKAGNRKKAAGKALPDRFFLTTLATKIRDTLLCNRSISVVDSITPKIILPTQGLENAPEKDASANRPPMLATSQDHEEETELRPQPDEAAMDNDSGLSSGDDIDELTRELTGDLTERNKSNDSGRFSERAKKDTIDGKVTDETAQNPQSCDVNFLITENKKENPVRETVKELEKLTNPIMVYLRVYDFLDNCRTNEQWLDNPHDLTMAELKKVQTIINESKVDIGERTELNENLAETAQQVLQYQLPKLDKEQAWERLDIYERLLSGNTHSRKMRLYKTAFDNLSSHFGVDDPWHFQMRRLDKGLAGPMAFAHLVKTQDNPQKVLMLKTLLEQKNLLLKELNEVNQRYDALENNGFDDQPFAGNEQFAEMLKLSETENNIKNRLGPWDEKALNSAESMLNKLLKNPKHPVAGATSSRHSRKVADETAQNPQFYDLNSLITANEKANPVRETVKLLENLKDPITVNYHVSEFLKNCQTNKQWLNNPHDLNMAVLKKLQTIINDSSVNMQEKARLDKDLAITAQRVLQYQLPQLDKKQAWERLDIYERLLSGNTYSRKMRLYRKAFDNLSSHFGVDDPWHFQMRRLDKGLAGPMAFAHLVKTQDAPQKVLMLKTLLKQKTLLLKKLNEVNQHYDALKNNGFDDQPFAGNEQFAEMLNLSKTENNIKNRLGTWDEKALNKAERMLKNLPKNQKHPVAGATSSRNSELPPTEAGEE